MSSSSKPVLVIFAPTACGKTALSVELFGKGSLSVLKDRGEVVSADSMAVYRGCDIATAKPDAAERAAVPHHLIDIIEPQQPFGAGEFVPLADSACDDILSRGKLPVVLGGTGFYIRNFLVGLPPSPVSDPAVRNALKDECERSGVETLYHELCLVDPESASRIDRHDAYRILRALEIYRITGKPREKLPPPALRPEYNFCTIELNRPRAELNRRIDERVDAMFKRGLADEYLTLRRSGIPADAAAFRAIGYSEFADCERKRTSEDGSSAGEGNFSFTEEELAGISSLIKTHSHQYAKKQQTYLHGIPDAVEFYADNLPQIIEKITAFCASVHLT